MKASDNLKYIDLLEKCPSLFREESTKIAEIRKGISQSTQLSDEERECYSDLLDSADILFGMILPFQHIIGLVTKYRGVALFNFNNIFNCEAISPLGLYKFLVRQNADDQKTVIKKLTGIHELRDRLLLAIESKKPKQFISMIEKSNIDKNVLMGIFALDYGQRFSAQTIEVEDDTDVNVGTFVKYVFSIYEHVILDLVHTNPNENNDELIDIIIRILREFDFESSDLTKDLTFTIEIRKRICPLTFKETCLKLMYILMMGFFTVYDRKRLDSTEIGVIKKILCQPEFKADGVKLMQECEIVLSDMDEFNHRNNNDKSLRALMPDVRMIVKRSKNFIDTAIEKNSKGTEEGETFECDVFPSMSKVQECINALASWGYIDDNVEVKKILYYRLTGYARPDNISKITWHKDINVLYLLIKTVLDKKKGKYNNIPNFFIIPDDSKVKTGKESAYAERVKDKRILDLMGYLIKN